MSGRKGERGAVLVAVLMVLALLSLLGAGAMLSASLDTQATGNQRESRLSFYAAEASLDYAVDQIVKAARDPADPASVLPYGKYEADGAEHPVGAIPGLAGSPGSLSAQYTLSYIVELLPGQTDPVEVNWSTTENAQALLNYARGYIVTGIATNKDDTNVKERVKETVRILRRPLSQYLAFYEGDMNWRPQTAMSVGGGRVHASGSIYLAPQNGITFTKQDTWGGPSVFAMTSGADIRLYEELQEGGAVSTTGSGGVTLPDGDLTDDVQPSNQATQEEAHMILVGGRPRDSHIRIGVDAMRSLKASALGPNAFYARTASGAVEPEPGTDCIHISGDPAVITLTYWNGGLSAATTVTVDDLIHAYESAAGQKVKFLDNATDPDSKWTLDALGNADGSLASDADPPIPGTIVYGFDSPPAWDEVDPMPKYGAGDYNPDYPTTLGAAGVQDPREGMEVQFTVVDLQRLECWYRDFLIENGIVTPAQFGARKLLVYATRTAGLNPLQAVKVVGSLPGRWRRPVNGKTAANRQLNETALVPTTLVTDLPLYIEGDFSSSSVNSPSGKPVAVVADSVTALSNSWGINHHPDTAASVGTWGTAYSAAFFAGRHDPATGGSSGAAEGVENLLRLVEDWSTQPLFITGSLNSLWYSTWAASEFDEGAFGAPAAYSIGWNPQFGDLTPEETPPYVPSVFMVERESWQEH